MAQTERDAASSFPGLILVILMSVGALLAQQLPLPSSRPAEAPVAQPAERSQQNVDARLWQDPFEAIGKITRNQDQPDGKTLHVPTSACDADAAGTFLIMAVMLGGSPYAEAVETRRRTRYAVLSGLARSGYVPRDHEHIGLVRPEWAGKPIDVPFEWLYRDDLKPLSAFGDKQTPAPKGNQAPQNLLVLWVNELPIREDPLAGLRAIVSQTCCPSGATPTVVIGPSNSDTLRTMLGKSGSGATWPGLRIYSPRATAPDAILIRGTSRAGAAIPDQSRYCPVSNESVAAAFWNAAKIDFHRTIATDCDLAASLVTELRNRDVQAGDGMVLISEWDTAYGRALPQAFLEKNGTPKNSGALWQFSYLRGLDGKLPGDAADKQAAPDKTSGKSAEKTDAEIETPFGNHQKDYLRRLGDRIDDLDRDLKRNCRLSESDLERSNLPCREQGVEAIGILGSDVYDKLLILKALRLRFPAAIYFTTDLDARLLHPQEWAATRNLVVASGYDLRLHGKLQYEIPPFRDGYQTAYFYIAQEVSRAYTNSTEPLAQGAPPPRLFEVGRTRAIDLSPVVKACVSPHPDNSPPPRPAWFAVLLPALLLLLLWYGSLKSVAHSHIAADVSFVRKWHLEIGTLLLFGWLSWLGYCIWNDVFVVGTAGGGEPFSWVDGVSVWPSVMLRALTGVLALYLLLRGMHRLWQNDERLTTLFFATHPPGTETTSQDHPLSDRILDPAQPPCPPCRPDSDKAICIWRDTVQPRPFTWPQFWRLTLGVFILGGIAVVLMTLFPDTPNIPYRGNSLPTMNALAIHWQTLNFAVVSYLYLLAFVIDSTRRTCCLARRLGNRQRTTWPVEALERWFGARAPSSYRCAHDDWIDIQLIAARTTVVGSFIYAPFLILSLIILARSGYTDNWQLPPGLNAMFVFYLLTVLACALMLRQAAERARMHALANLDEEIIVAQGDAAREADIGQLKSLRDSIANEHRGAFSSFLNQPWLKALLLPLGSYSGIQLFEALSQAKL